MSLDVLALIMAQIVKVLNRAGFWGKRQLEKRPGIKDRRCHGFDESKFNGASLFYLPCQPKNPRDAFFIDYGDGDPKRGPLDLHQWIETCILSLRPDPEPMAAPVSAIPISSEISVRQVVASLENVRQTLTERATQTLAERREGWIAEAVERWHGTACVPGTGHAEFFRLGAALHRAELDDQEIRAKLYEEAAYARSPRERRSEIKGVLTSLRRRGTFKGAAR